MRNYRLGKRKWDHVQPHIAAMMVQSGDLAEIDRGRDSFGRFWVVLKSVSTNKLYGRLTHAPVPTLHRVFRKRAG